MIDTLITDISYSDNGVEKTPTNTLLPFYVEKISDTFFHIELNNQQEGRDVSEITINGQTYLTADAAIDELRRIRGWQVPQVIESIDFQRRQNNINQMNAYMDSLRVEGSLTQANFDLFLADTATNVQQYLGGGGRLITWIETVNRNGYNASTIGFKTKTAYRGTLVNGVYPRAEMILSILNNL